jgi:preprotein translocase subunit YajC
MILSILASGDNQQGGGFGIFLFLPLMLAAMYFLMIRPQKKRQREQAALQRAIEVGDEIMTTSGVYGFVTGFDGDIAWLEIDDNVQIRVARQAIQRKVDTAGGDTALPSDDGSGKGRSSSTIIPADGTAVQSDSDK